MYRLANNRNNVSAYFGINVIPNAIPLFSMYDIKNQSVMRMLSCRHILFLTHSFMAWSIRRSSATKSAYRSPFLIVTKMSQWFLLFFSFDSTERVACGTRRRRSFGISSPVMRSMPYVLFWMRTKACSRPLMNFC